MIENISINCHSSIRIEKNIVMYFDPYNILKKVCDANIIFITHSHYDHFSEKDIENVKNNETKIVIPKDLKEKVKILGFIEKNIYIVEPNQSITIDDIMIQTILSYNVNKKFHPKEKQWLGYIITVEGIQYYIAGDTDITEENRKVTCDIAFLPIGGTYTMNAKEAAQLANKIHPSIVVPIHYGSIVGSKEDEKIFQKNLNQDIICNILIK